MKILFFARLKEQLGKEWVEIPDEDCPADVGALRQKLQLVVNAELAESLEDPNVFCAVNQKVVGEKHRLASSDEVAFFPPMTGG
ncbi:MoaD/ThiS family protein [Congregibacter litoralis]|uniref:Molybdopterin synthase subunit MoaD n=1 Tax=Congregibacter litoralis KT71 TaxID=314285 RepID=A4A3E1_9GAMM|nr:MoaD/ThiS family protein [Congregibacter litoralis]EAQ99214.1 molybdopterin synthase subunit MoaD [Congregibacter litoralis KT71]